MTTLTIGITIQDIAVIIIKNMDISLRTTLEHISVETIIVGWVKPHVLVVTRLVISERIFQLSLRHPNLNLTKAKQKLSIQKMRWIGHEKRKILKVHSMEKGSHHPMGQMVTLHQTKQKEVCGMDI